MAKRGRPPTLRNKEIIDRIIENIKNGIFVETAANLSGISKTQFYEWLRIAKNARKKEKKTDLELQMIDFADRVMVARAEARKDLLVGIITHPDWKARAWCLERMNPGEFTLAQKIEADVKTTNKTEVTHKLTDAQLKALGDALAEESRPLS
jgi:hypothetical protein